MTKDIELKTGGEKNTSYTRFGLAVNRKFKNAEGKYDTDFPNCVAIGKTAENIAKFFHKGSMIAVTGRIQTGSYKNKDGQTVYTTDVMIEDFDFVESKKKADGGEARESKPDDFMEMPSGLDTEDLPFA